MLSEKDTSYFGGKGGLAGKASKAGKPSLNNCHTFVDNLALIYAKTNPVKRKAGDVTAATPLQIARALHRTK